MAKKAPVLSIGMIVKNEEKKLERCLCALQPLRDAIPCELLIADTGSTDNTHAIAERYADTVLDVEWTNDFSAARNAVMDIACGDWYLTVDADEYLDDATELVQFLTGPHAKKTDIATVVIRSYTQSDPDGDASLFSAVRLLRTALGLRYEGKIHERWNITTGMKWHHLAHTIFNHDGYFYRTEQEHINKARRNLTLLKDELKEDPEDSMLILQCMESSGPLVQEAVEYSHRGMELIQREPRIPYWDVVAGPICRKAVNFAARYQMPEWDDWMTWGEKNLSDSPFIRVDVAYYRLCWLHHKKKYEQVPSAADRFCAAWQEYHDGKYGPEEFMMSSLYYTSSRYISFAKAFKARAYLALGRDDEALCLLQEVNLNHALPDLLEAWLDAMECAADLPDASTITAKQLAGLMLDTQDSTRTSRQTLYSRIAAAFLPSRQDAGWRIYTDLDSDQGRGARLFATDKATQAQSILEQIQNWGEIPPTVLAHVWQIGASLPSHFYEQSSEELHDTTVRLAEYDANFAAHTLIQLHQTRDIADFSILSFDFQLVIAALQKGSAEEGQFRALCIWFGRIGENYLQNMYHPDRLQDEQSIRFLPALHRFTWYFLLAKTAATQGDATTCVHALRQSLVQAPIMKNMVETLLPMVENNSFPTEFAAASPELLELADKIRSILQQYPADDPVVQAIKQSDAYKKVAYLIEDPDTMWII
ncbi:glycosyltransferase [Agathobaculum sp. Marseille-P7918]|uniref:glycosyltransferase n=1 Tax=Agathobaculum sp. Marseille-P7918 TaxID=2479843 RepID=UPI0035638C71